MTTLLEHVHGQLSLNIQAINTFTQNNSVIHLINIHTQLYKTIVNRVSFKHLSVGGGGTDLSPELFQPPPHQDEIENVKLI